MEVASRVEMFSNEQTIILNEIAAKNENVIVKQSKAESIILLIYIILLHISMVLLVIAIPFLLLLFKCWCFVPISILFIFNTQVVSRIKHLKKNLNL